MIAMTTKSSINVNALVRQRLAGERFGLDRVRIFGFQLLQIVTLETFRPVVVRAWYYLCINEYIRSSSIFYERFFETGHSVFIRN